MSTIPLSNVSLSNVCVKNGSINPYTATSLVASTKWNFTVPGPGALLPIGNFRGKSLITATPNWMPNNAIVPVQNWYVANSSNVVFSSGTTIQQWSDLSGNNRHATPPSAATAPVLSSTGLNNMPMVDFNNVSGVRLNVTSVNSAAFTIAIVAKYNSLKTSNFQDLVITAGPYNVQGFVDIVAMMNTRNINVTVYDSSLYTGFTFTDNTPFFIIVTGTVSKRLSVITTYVNGNLTGTTGPSVTVTSYLLSSLHMGGWDQSATRTMDGGISEFVIYHSALSTSDRQKLEGYLAHKWGLSGNLPAGHPFKSAAPTA